jgi:hypothetical protein
MKLGSRSLLLTTLLGLAACSAGAPGRSANSSLDANKSANPSALQATEARRPNTARIIHALVALCDNEHQGIVPVPARLGNGEDLQGNLYWGAAYGVKAFFAKSPDWKLVEQTQNHTSSVLERCIFKNKNAAVYLIADAYRGAEIKRALVDFFDYASGGSIDEIAAHDISKHPTINAGGAADLIVFVGHNGLMDFNLPAYPTQKDGKRRDAIILCCASKSYFSAPLRKAGADPILWTNGLMAPEAYLLKAALDGWIANESGEQIRSRAAEAYNRYQHCGLKAARGLFASGW